MGTGSGIVACCGALHEHRGESFTTTDASGAILNDGVEHHTGCLIRRSAHNCCYIFVGRVHHDCGCREEFSQRELVDLHSRLIHQGGTSLLRCEFTHATPSI
jgi:hypothetical protein